MRQPSSKWRFYEEHGGHYLGSDVFDALDEPSGVREAAQEMIDVINGLFRSSHSVGWRDVTIRGLSRREPGKPATQYLALETIHAAPMLRSLTLTVEGEPRVAAPDPAFILDDDVLRKVLRLFSRHPLDWGGMYRIYEVIEGADKGMVKGSRWRVFKRTANNPAVTGDESRHGKQSAAPPSNPVSKSEAQRMIQQLVEAFKKKRARLSG